MLSGVQPALDVTQREGVVWAERDDDGVVTEAAAWSSKLKPDAELLAQCVAHRPG